MFNIYFPHISLASIYNDTNLSLPPMSDEAARSLLSSLLAYDPKARPTADQALVHAYFTAPSKSERTEDSVVASKARISALLEHLRVLKLSHSSYASSTVEISRLKSSDPLAPARLDPKKVIQSMKAYLQTEDKIFEPIRVKFTNEDGYDAGGLLGAMYSQFFEVLFSPSSEYFEQADRDTYLPKADSSVSAADMKLIGAMTLKAIVHGRNPSVKFPPFVYQYILSSEEVSVDISDLESYDFAMSRNLRLMLLTPGVDDLCLSFEGLCVGGEKKDVTDLNKEEYAALKINNYLINKRKANLDAFVSGFKTISALEHHLGMFTPYDLKLLMLGEERISNEDIKALLKFESFSNETTPNMFREMVDEMTTDELRQLLHFISNFVSIPVGGFGTYDKLTIRNNAATDGVPISHTCFLTLDLPDYKNKQKLVSNVKLALANHQHTGGSFSIR